MSLVVDPPACAIAAAGASATHQLVNSGAERLVFKVKCSNNAEYRIRPVYGFVEPASATPMEINRLAGAPKDDKLVIPFGVVAADASDPNAAFQTIAANLAGTITVQLQAT